VHIAIVSEHADPSTAGSVDAGDQNAHVAGLAVELGRAGHAVTVWTRRTAPDTPATSRWVEGVTVRRLWAGPAETLPRDQLVQHLPQLADGLRRAWSADPPDVVHSHFWMSGLAALAAVRPLGIPLVQTFHGLGHVERRHLGSADPSPRGRVAAERAVARAADRVVATYADEATELMRLGARHPTIAVVPCGVDTDMFHPVGSAALVADGRHRLVVVRRSVCREGVDEVVDALRRLPGTELVVAGGPPAADLAEDPDARRVLVRAERAGVAGRVRLLGAVDPADMPALLRSADIVVCPPWFEPSGLMALRAMASGRPVVATEVGGLAETVVDGLTGLFVPPRRPDVLATSLRRLLAAPALRQAFGVAGRARAESCYDAVRAAADVAAVYSDAVSAHHRIPAPPGGAAPARLRR
jgi:D-inositol-3-phosphate glycosyltransferase